MKSKTNFPLSRCIDKIRLNRLKHLPRFQRGYFPLKGKKIKYLDPLALYHGYYDIFMKKIYHFETEKKNPLIIDLGGYIGLSALYFKNIYPDSSLHVFEPVPSVFDVLKKNLEKNQVQNVQLHNAGAGNKKETKTFFTDDSGGANPYFLETQIKIKVKIVQLSKFIIEPVDFLKMNVEGMEHEILTEIEPKLFLIKKIAFEYHNFKNLPQNLGNILNLLVRNGFHFVIKDIPSIKKFHPEGKKNHQKNYNLIYAQKKENVS